MDKQKIYLEKEFREIIENRIGGVGCVNGLVSDLADKCATVNSINGTNLFINQGMEGDCVIIITPAELAVLLPNLHMFKNLRQLVVTKFVDLPYISQWTESLEEVVLHREYNALSDLCRLPKLRKVSLLYKDADIAKLRPIAEQLQELAFSSLKDENELSNFQNLELLTFGYGMDGENLKHFSHLSKLRRLFIEHFSCATLDGLENCHALENLRIQTAHDGTSLFDIGALSSLPALRYVALLGDGLHDLAPLAHIPTLESLMLCNSAVLDYSALAEMKYLKKLRLTNCLLDDLSVLEPLENLEELTIRQIHTEDYTPLLKLPKLKTVEVEDGSKLPRELCERLGMERPAPRPRMSYNGFETHMECFDN